MKKISGLTLVALFCVLGSLFGQEDISKNFISKGDWLAGGTMNFSTTEGFLTGANTFTLEPRGAYFVGEKFATGLALSYRSEESINSFSILPFLRYYYFSQKRLAPYFEVGCGVASESTVYYTADGGVDYFLSKNVALEINLGYFQTNHSQSGLGLTVGLQFFIR